MKLSNQAAEAIIAVLLIALVLVAFLRFKPNPQAEDPLPQSPVTVLFESKDHETVSYYELETRDESGAVLDTLLLPKAQTRVVGQTEQGPTIEVSVDLYPLAPGPYTYVIRAVTESAGAAEEDPTKASPNNTRVPPAGEIRDTELDVWTLQGNQAYEDGRDTGGTGTELRWCNGVVYIAEGDGDWWLWAGYGWTGPAPEPCAGLPPPSAGTPTIGRSANSNVSNPWQRAPIAVF